MAQTSIETYFDRLADQYDSGTEKSGNRNDAVFSNVVGRIATGHNYRSLLDLGVGTGRTVLEAARHLNLTRIVGVDTSAGMLDIATQKLGAAQVPFEAVHQPIEDYLNAATEQFDIVSCVSVLDSAGNHSEIIQGVRERLHQYGVFIFNYIPVIYGHPNPTFGELESTFHHPSGMEMTCYRQHPQYILRALGESGLAVIDQELFCPKPEDPSIVVSMMAAIPNSS